MGWHRVVGVGAVLYKERLANLTIAGLGIQNLVLLPVR